MRFKTFSLLLCTLILLSGGCLSTTPPRPLKPELSRSSAEEYSYDVYYVEKGDTLHSIGRREGVHWRRIAQANQCMPANLRVGQTLLIPRYEGSAPDYDIPEGSPSTPARPRKYSYRDVSIVIDAGHGGKDPGAISPIGLQEKDINLAVAVDVARALRQCGMKVTLTRKDDTFVELDERGDIANRMGADLFVSIHTDSAKNASARGFTVYTKRNASPISHSMASAVIKGLSKGLSKGGMQNRGVREADYRVLVRTRCPAVLVELGFLSNKAEARMLRKRKIQKSMASEIVNGIKNFVRSRGSAR